MVLFLCLVCWMVIAGDRRIADNLMADHRMVIADGTAPIDVTVDVTVDVMVDVTDRRHGPESGRAGRTIEVRGHPRVVGVTRPRTDA
jgi:hypothetical protein